MNVWKCAPFGTLPNIALEPSAPRLTGARRGSARTLASEDRRQERLFPTTIGGGATTVELAHQVVGHHRRSKSLKLAALAPDLADRSSLVALCLLIAVANSPRNQFLSVYSGNI